MQKWPGDDGVLHASVNSFGFGGTNSHLILESAPKSTPCHDIHLTNGFHETLKINGSKRDPAVNGALAPELPLLFVVSAKTKRSLNQNLNLLQTWVLKQSTNKSLMPSLAQTLNTRRSQMAWRSSFVASSISELDGSFSSARLTKASSTHKMTFIFTGQGAQWFGMGRELLNTNTVFAESISRSETILSSLGSSWSLTEELRKDKQTTRINESQISQPATTSVQIALVDVLKSLSIFPTVVLGHSSGEIGAAYAAGILSQESALKIAYHRGFASSWYQELSNVSGAMIAVGLGMHDVEPYLGLVQSGALSIACQNSPVSTTVSGDENAIDELKCLLDLEAIWNRKLQIDTAYHSHHMKMIANKYLEALGEIKYAEPLPSTRFFSSVTAEEKISNFEAAYWVENLTSTVRFSDALQKLVLADTQTLHLILEIGSHAALQGPIRQSITHLENSSPKYSYLPTLLRDQDARISLLDTVGKLFEHGCTVNLEIANRLSDKIGPSKGRVLTNLPPYAWDVTKHWHESRLSREYRFRAAPYHDLLGLRIIGSTPLEPSWRNILTVDALPWLQEHIIDNFALFPGSAFLCMAIQAVLQRNQERSTPQQISKFILKEITFSKALIIPNSPDKVEVVMSLRSVDSPEKGSSVWEQFRVTSIGNEGTWNEHCRGFITVENATLPGHETERNHEEELTAKDAVEHVDKMEEACGEIIDTTSFYEELRKNGIDYGPTFSTIKRLRIGDRQALGHVQIPDVAAYMPSGHLEPHVIHPATFDALMHIALPLYNRHCSKGPAMLISIDEVVVSANIFNLAGAELIVGCDLTPTGPLSGSVDVSVLQADAHSIKREVLTLSGQTFRGIGEGSTTTVKNDTLHDKSFEIKLQDFQGSCGVKSLPSEVLIIANCDINTVNQLASGLCTHLLSKGIKASMYNEPASSAGQDATYLIIRDYKEDGFHENLSVDQTITTRAKFTMIVNLLPSTVTKLRYKPQAQAFLSPQKSNQNANVIAFNVWGETTDEYDAIDSIFDALASSFLNYENNNAYEREYIYDSTKQVKVPRLKKATGFSDWVARNDGKKTVELDSIHQMGKCLKAQVETPGLLDSLIFVDDESAKSLTGIDELEIEVQAHAVNQKDVVIAMGRLSSSTPMIGEISGIVTSVGLNAEKYFKVGDRVCGFGGSSYQTRSRINHNLVQRIPDSMTFAQGASIPYAFQTAYHALVDIASLQHDGSVLIHSALSSVGMASILGKLTDPPSSALYSRGTSVF